MTQVLDFTYPHTIEVSAIAMVLGLLIVLGFIIRISWFVFESSLNRESESPYDQTLIIENEPPNLRRLLKYRKY
jgi:hypothetical protein